MNPKVSDGIRDPIILDGPAFPWGQEQNPAVRDDGTVDWRAAMNSDPGLMTCPGCGVYLWAEGNRVRCPDCGHEWTTRNARAP
jgi:predicted RNA-binding Zn-ribbon protein involved in translation (DUF1610 family)